VDELTGVLRNKLGLADGEALYEAELAEAQINAPAAMAFADVARYVNEATLKQIHNILFGAVYDWAGNFRTVYLRKVEGGPQFAAPDRLEGEMKRRILPSFNRLARRAGADDRVFADALAKCWGELNELHPFREGNGRATQIFVTALAHRYGRDIDWGKVGREEEITAARAAMARDYTGYVKILGGAMGRWGREQAGGPYWPIRSEQGGR
jgi:cell filamentation protein